MALAILVAGATGAAAKTPLPERADRSVYDVANVIDDAREQQIEAIDRELFARARVAVVVVTVPQLVDETISELALRVQHDWGVGERGKDESVVIAVSGRRPQDLPRHRVRQRRLLAGRQARRDPRSRDAIPARQ